jgi:hypothetical protein
MPGPRKNRPIVIGVASDLHCGSTVAVCPDEGLPLDDGGRYHPSKVQRWLWHCWIDFWSKVGALVAEHEAEFWLAINGDMVDGDHHDTPQIVSRKLNVQEICALKVLELPLSFKPKHTFVVRGTEVHVGKGADDEEKIARQIGAEQEPDTENHSWWQAMIEANGTLIDFQHHGRRGYRYWTAANAVQMLAAEITASWATEERMPDLSIRSHVHISKDSYDNFPIRVITTPAWQLKTAFVHRIGPESLSSIGGLAIVCHPGGKYEVEKFPYEPKRAPIWQPR